MDKQQREYMRETAKAQTQGISLPILWFAGKY